MLPYVPSVLPVVEPKTPMTAELRLEKKLTTFRM